VGYKLDETREDCCASLSPTTVGVGYKLDETREDCCASLMYILCV
jgi:hypothetical protein